MKTKYAEPVEMTRMTTEKAAQLAIKAIQCAFDHAPCATVALSEARAIDKAFRSYADAECRFMRQIDKLTNFGLIP